MAKTTLKDSINNNLKNIKIGKEKVRILIMNNEYSITGWLYLPIPSVVENPTNENLLFYALNCGNKFIQIHDYVIMNKENIEYQPERVKCYNINLDIVHSCQIITED